MQKTKGMTNFVMHIMTKEFNLNEIVHPLTNTQWSTGNRAKLFRGTISAPTWHELIDWIFHNLKERTQKNNIIWFEYWYINLKNECPLFGEFVSRLKSCFVDNGIYLHVIPAVVIDLAEVEVQLTNGNGTLYDSHFVKKYEFADDVGIYYAFKILKKRYE